jgi:hypothetical protein
MSMFWQGFEKRALAQEDGKPSLLRRALPAAAAGAAGLGAYALSRGRAKTTLTKTLFGKAPTSRLGRAVDRTLYGADAVHYTRPSASFPKKPVSVKGTVLHADVDTARFVKGKRNIGGATPGAGDLEHKGVESRMLNKVAPSMHTPTISGRVTGRGLKNLKALHGKQKHDYLIKAMYGADSGVGGASFLHRADVEKHLSGKTLRGKKRRLLDDFLRSPEKHILQKKIDIAKDRLTGAPSEFRVHALEGKTVPHASMVRGKNYTDATHLRGAEKALQSVLNKMPSKAKKGLMVSADVARDTKGKFKIIELNRGGNISGLLDPKHLQQRFKGAPGAAAAAHAVRGNHALYKHITGRHSQLSSAGRGLAAAGAVGTGTTAAMMGNSD